MYFIANVFALLFALKLFKKFLTFTPNIYMLFLFFHISLKCFCLNTTVYISK